MKPNATAGFRICDNKGFHLTFANGYTVSVQFGPGNYGSNHDAPFDLEMPVTTRKPWTASTAETACWGPDGEMLALMDTPEGGYRIVSRDWNAEESADTVQGYRTPAQVLALMDWAAKQEAP